MIAAGGSGPPTLLANAFDANRDSLSIAAINGSSAKVDTWITLASGASLYVSPNGTFTYVATAGFVGYDTFSYTVTDGAETAVATASIDVLLVPVEFQSATYSVYEAAGEATINVVLDEPSSLPVTVNYATSDGTATAGTNYTSTSGTLTFTAGQTSASFDVPVLNDDGEGGTYPLTVNLALSDPSDAVLGTLSTATLLIQNDVSLTTKVATNTDPVLTVPLNDSCGCGSNFPNLALQYTPSASVQPIIETLVATYPGGPMPTQFSVTLTWNGTAGSPVTFSTTGHSPGDVFALGMQVPAVVSSSGTYPYQVQVVTSFSADPDSTSTVSGTAAVTATGSTPDGYGWTLTSNQSPSTQNSQVAAPAASTNPLVSDAASTVWTDALTVGDHFIGVSGGVLWVDSQGRECLLHRTGWQWRLHQPGQRPGHPGPERRRQLYLHRRQSNHEAI